MLLPSLRQLQSDALVDTRSQGRLQERRVLECSLLKLLDHRRVRRTAYEELRTTGRDSRRLRERANRLGRQRLRHWGLTLLLWAVEEQSR